MVLVGYTVIAVVVFEMILFTSHDAFDDFDYDDVDFDFDDDHITPDDDFLDDPRLFALLAAVFWPLGILVCLGFLVDTLLYNWKRRRIARARRRTQRNLK